MGRLQMKTRGPEQLATALSGGNQQKLLLARALLCNPDLLILDEPTRGIDVGAKAEIYHWIVALARTGKAVLLISSELPEILGLSHRVMILCEGRVTAEMAATDAAPEEVLRRAMPAGWTRGALEC
jgi:ABC-type sugar transport system ATPase subunit